MPIVMNGEGKGYINFISIPDSKSQCHPNPYIKFHINWPYNHIHFYGLGNVKNFKVAAMLSIHYWALTRENLSSEFPILDSKRNA